MLIVVFFVSVYGLFVGCVGMFFFGYVVYFGVGVFVIVYGMNVFNGSGLLFMLLLLLVGVGVGLVFGVVVGWFVM